jgi:Family of unknown function (DUF6492)
LSTFAVLTPSYAPDFELCRELNRSVLEWTEAEVEHHLVVPGRDRELFSQLGGPRTRVWDTAEFIPRGMLPLPMANAWLNIRRPFPPIRGWIMQQVVKLAAAAALGVDVLLLADSDVTFVRPVTVGTFRKDGYVRFYRADEAINAEMSRHVLWHEVAHRLLALPSVGPPPLPDYICPLNSWDREVVLALQERVERVTRRPWLEAIASQIHVSEFILYGVFVDQVLATSTAMAGTPASLCHTYLGPEPLAPEAVQDFVALLAPDAVAVMISAKTGTPASVRREALTRVRAATAART